MSYLANPTHYTRDEFKALVDGLTWDRGWSPRFATAHNTGVPSLKMWEGWGSTPQERWGENLNRYYKGLGWHSAVHLVACPDYIWNLCDLRQDGISVSCWNHETLGLEMVGNYEVGGDEFDIGDGAKVRDNAVWALAVLHRKLGWSPSTLHFHRECPQDHHACPGSKVNKADFVARIVAQMAALGVAQPAQPLPPMRPPAPSYAVGSVRWIQSKLGVVVDGDVGDETRAAIKAFQAAHNLDADGIVGLRTMAALDVATA